MKVFSQKKMNSEEVEAPGAHVFFITAAPTCPLNCQRLEASVGESARVYVNMFMVFICVQLQV